MTCPASRALLALVTESPGMLRPAACVRLGVSPARLDALVARAGIVAHFGALYPPGQAPSYRATLPPRSGLAASVPTTAPTPTTEAAPRVVAPSPAHPSPAPASTAPSDGLSGRAVPRNPARATGAGASPAVASRPGVSVGGEARRSGRPANLTPEGRALGASAKAAAGEPSRVRVLAALTEAGAAGLRVPEVAERAGVSRSNLAGVVLPALLRSGRIVARGSTTLRRYWLAGCEPVEARRPTLVERVRELEDTVARLVAAMEGR